MSINLSRYRDLYFSEAHEQIEHIAEGLKKLESGGNDRAAVESAFRYAHTLKGMSATMGYDEATASAHQLEMLLEVLRDNGGTSPSNLHLLFRALDNLQSVLAHVQGAETPAATPPSPPPEPRDEPPLDDSPAGATAVADTVLQARADPSPAVRISIPYLDHLSQLVAELVVNHAKLAYSSSPDRAPGFDPTLHAQSRMVKELQALTRLLGMGPLGDIFNRYLRMVHDLAREQDKEVLVIVEGESVQVARAVLEELNDPLLHLLRNAVTHGIETTAERSRCGKNARGTITLRARPSGDEVTVEVSDDGRGLDAPQILQAAYEQGFVTGGDPAQLGESEIFRLILLPGFSLASVVTTVVGRGVGLNVVQAKLDSVNGRISIRAQPGHGATFSLTVPRTWGMHEVELVRVADQVYALPGSRVERTLTLSSAEVLRLRRREDLSRQSLPIVNLQWLIEHQGHSLREGIARVDEEMTRAQLRADVPPDEYRLIVVHPTGMNPDEPLALRVDELLGEALLRLTEPTQVSPVDLLDLDQLISFQ